MPPVQSCACLHRSHQTKLKCITPVIAQHADTGEIAGISHMRGRNQAREADWLDPQIGQPPGPLLEFRDGGGIKKGPTMSFGQYVQYLFILRVHFPDAIHQHPPQR